MDVQLSLNLPSSGSENLANISSTSSGKIVDDDGFSNHLDDKIDRINAQQKSTKKSDANASKSSVNQEVNDNSSVNSTEGSVTSDDAKKSVVNEAVSSVLAAELAFKADDIIPQNGTGLSVLALANTGELTPTELVVDALPPGNSLPDVALLDDKLPLSEVVPIVFDPLSDAVGDSLSAPILLAGVQSPPSWKLQGQNVATGFVDKSVESLGIANADIVKSDAKLFQSLTVATDVGLAKQASVTDSLISTASITGQGVQQQPSALATDTKLSLSVETPVSSPRWGNDFSNRIQWMVGQSISGAQIRLNPQQLGPIEVRVHIHNDQATISFTAQHGATREAIDAALPRLRDMLSEQQVDLVDVNVSQHSFAEQQEQRLANQSGDEQADDVSSSTALDSDEVISNSLDNSSTLYTGLFSQYA
ncbi:MAG: hypothetical protein COB26_09315 [Piscirickettsiaceae bacterium]|nr:MAG: hypothetical protein COB89_01980 [Piscirickettsiaceae bacterium]PCI67785.1 MAG: hypothetical protein COB26_09315 [Piscirickettsiaceae bacterium]